MIVKSKKEIKTKAYKLNKKVTLVLFHSKKYVHITICVKYKTHLSCINNLNGFLEQDKHYSVNIEDNSIFVHGKFKKALKAIKKTLKYYKNNKVSRNILISLIKRDLS